MEVVQEKGREKVVQEKGRGKEDSVSFQSDEIPIPDGLRSLKDMNEECVSFHSSGSPSWEPPAYEELDAIVLHKAYVVSYQSRPSNSKLSRERTRQIKVNDLKEMSAKTGKTVDELEMERYAYTGGENNWICKSEWIPAAADGHRRQHVKIVDPAIKIDSDASKIGKRKICQDAMSLRTNEPYSVLHLDVFCIYQLDCDYICRYLRPQSLQPGHVTYLVSIPINMYPRSSPSGQGHPVAVIAERVAFVATIKVRAEHPKRFICGELDVTFLSSAPFDYPLSCWSYNPPSVTEAKLAEELLVEGVLDNIEGDSLVVNVNFTVKNTGELAYTARVTFYDSLDPEWF